MGYFSTRLGRVLKLGRRTPAVKKKVRKVSEFVRGALPTPPNKIDFAAGVPSWPMYANDQYGDCVFACCGHQVGCWTFGEVGKEVLFTDQQILAMYSAVTGFDPNKPWTDQGAVITDALDYWIRAGLGGDRLAGYLAAEVNSTAAIQFAAWVFGGLHIGIAMPAAWQGAVENGRPWDIGPNLRGPWAPGSWGGHAVPVVAYDSAGVTIVTWGTLQKLTWAGLHQYCDEAYACASWDWCVDNTTPAGIAKADLLEYWASLGGGPLPPQPGPPAPPPPPPVPGGVIVVDPASKTIAYPPDWSAVISSGNSSPTAKSG